MRTRPVDDGARGAMIQAVHAYVTDKVIPVAGEFERTHEFPHEIIADLTEMGLLRMNIPEQWGGLDLDLATRSGVFRENQLDVGRINIANLGVGVGQAAYDAAARYAADRTAFGQAIDSLEGIQFKLAEMATKLYAARVVAGDVAARYDAGEDVSVEAAMAKYFCSEVGIEVSLDAVRIHGGAGYVSDFPVERFFRDAPLNAIGEGTNEILKMLIARGLKKRAGGTGATR
jgi:alkylation response protein AidB-like acyl-CoA dehydrogenase